MYRLLIVDDEPNIVDSLYIYFQDIELLELDVYRAHSAFEALEWLDRTNMDIVITDIRMPGMNGIQLLGNIRRNWPFCKIIFLTGYDEFEYAHTAIKYGGVNYVLKSEGYDEVVAAVGKAVTEIEQTMQDRELVRISNLRMEAVIPLMQQEYLNGVLQGEVYAEEERNEHFEQIKLPLRADLPILMMITRLENFPRSISWIEKSRLIYNVKHVVEQHLVAAVQQIGIIGERSNLVWFIQPKTGMESELSAPVQENDWERAAVFIKGMSETLQTICMKSIEVSFSVLMDSEPSSWESVADHYQSLKQLEHTHLSAGLNMLIVDRSQLYTKGKDEACGSKGIDRERLRLLKSLEMHLERGDVQEFTEKLYELTALHHDPATYYSLSLIYLTYMERWSIADKITAETDVDKLTKAEEHKSWDEAIHYFLGLAELIFKLKFRDEEDRALSSVNAVKQFVNEHYGEDLSLVRLAQVVHFNPSYLSRLFKQVTGINLLNYINEVRINRARDLLLESDLKINEIAKRVGYITASNFTRFFKRAVNMAPQEYREAGFKR